MRIIKETFTNMNRFRDHCCPLDIAGIDVAEQSHYILIEHLPCAVFRSVCNGDRRFLYLSKVIEKICGFSAGECLAGGGIHYTTLIHPEDRDRVTFHLVESWRRAFPYMLQYRIRDKQGGIRWVCEQGQPVMGCDGQVRWLDGIILDVTEQKATEFRHRRLVCELEGFTQAITDLMFTTDVSGNLLWCNGKLLEVMDDERLIEKGVTVEELFVADRRYEISMSVAECFKHGIVEFEADLLAASGPTPYYVKLVVLRDEEGRIQGFAGSGRDMSLYKRLEKQLRQSQKMQAVGQLTGGIAHDFNNFLTAILGFTELALQRSRTLADEKLERYLEEVNRAGQRARELVMQLLAYSRGGESQPVPVKPMEVLGEVHKMLASSLPSTMRLVIEPTDLQARILMDPLQFQQVLMNLCINARDAMCGQGEVRITTCERHIAELACSSCHKVVSGDFVELTVRDSGKGIAEADLERIFEPFFSTKSAGKGTGMGLAMVHGILHQHGGHIHVESRLGEGTDFRLLLPVMKKEPSNLLPVELAESPGGIEEHTRVLIVDDEAAVGHFLGELLHIRGCETLVFTDSREALDFFAANPQAFDLVITDQAMPGLTGSELARKMLDMRPDLPIILCTGYSEYLDEIQAQRLGIRHYLTKPIDVMVFVNAVNELLDYRPGRTMGTA